MLIKWTYRCFCYANMNYFWQNFDGKIRTLQK